MMRPVSVVSDGNSNYHRTGKKGKDCAGVEQSSFVFHELTENELESIYVFVIQWMSFRYFQ